MLSVLAKGHPKRVLVSFLVYLFWICFVLGLIHNQKVFKDREREKERDWGGTTLVTLF